MESVNPATGEVMASFAVHDAATASGIVAAAADAQPGWAAAALPERLAAVARLGALLRSECDEHATVMSREMGKPLAQARAEVEKCAIACDYYVARAEEMLRAEEIASDATTSVVRFRALGIVLAIMPWNYPYWQFIRVAIPTLCVGNGVVLKHASNVPQSALALERAFADAGFTTDLVRTVLLPGAETVPLIADERIAGVSLTGSEEVGRKVAAAAGAVLKPVVLELGGSDPFVVLGDADVPAVARAAAQARTVNSGQSCIAAKRFLVDHAIHDEFVAAFAVAMEAFRMGDPLDPATEVGPQARTDLRDAVHDQVRRSVDAGAVVVTGGEIPDGVGAYYPPTVLAGVTPGVPAFDEEVFGPVGAVCPFSGEEEAVALANDSPYGLGASVWGSDPDRIRAVRDGLDAGMVFVNGIVKSDPRLPFGGVKASGHGRELGRHGMLEFANVQTVWTG